MKPVRHMGILKAMQKAGLITFCKDTGKKLAPTFSNKKVIAYYIKDGPSSFVFNGEMYRTKYVDGCFYPFVFLLEN